MSATKIPAALGHRDAGAQSRSADRRRAVLVDGAWVEARLGDPDLVILEVDERPLVYRLGHIPGAHCLDWRLDLQDPVTRDIPDRDAIARLWRRIGLQTDSTVVFYGDKSNWYACFGFWLFRLYGVRDLRLLDGGRQAWLAEGRPLTNEEPPENMVGSDRHGRRRNIVCARVGATSWRKPPTASSFSTCGRHAEYRGDVLTDAGYPDEGAQRPGHIPGALSVPWDVAVRLDGRLHSDDVLRRRSRRARRRPCHSLRSPTAESASAARTPGSSCTSCSARRARNYDGSWTEWGSMIGMPVALGDEPGSLPRSLVSSR